MTICKPTYWKTHQGNQHFISTNIPKYPQLYTLKYINPGRDYCKSLLVITLKIFVKMVKRVGSVVFVFDHMKNTRKSSLKLICNFIILRGLITKLFALYLQCFGDFINLSVTFRDVLFTCYPLYFPKDWFNNFLSVL